MTVSVSFVREVKPKLSRVARKIRNREAAKAESAAVAVANWVDREGKARPTPERLAKGTFRLRDADDAGVTFAVDIALTELDRLANAHRISQVQCEAGHDFARLMDRTRLQAAPRSCIDFSPKGRMHNDETSHGEDRDERERAELYLSCGMVVWANLRLVCVDDQPVRNMAYFLRGLDILVKFWRLK